MNNVSRKTDWWVYCIGIFIIMGVIEMLIAYLYPSLDLAYSWSLFRTHHYFEMMGLFFLGLGMSRLFHLKGTIKEGQIMMWTIYLVTILIEITLKPFSPLIILLAISIIGVPLWIGFYGYLLFQKLDNRT